MINYIIINTNGENLDWFYDNEFVHYCIEKTTNIFSKQKPIIRQPKKIKSEFYFNEETKYKKINCYCGGKYIVLNKKRHYFTCRRHLRYEAKKII